MRVCPCANLERTAHRCRQYPAVSLSPASSGGCPMAESAFDWRLVVAGLAVAAVGAALVAWQTRGDPARCRGWLGWSALSLELLAAAMAVFWAVRNGSNVLTLLFAVGFIGLALAKAVTISALVHAGRAGNYGAVAVGVLAMAGAYLTVYGAGAFEGTMDGSQKAAEAAQRSAPALAMDSQLKAAYAKLEGLTAYADSTRAAESASKAENLHRRLQDARNRLAACPPTYITKCVDPARREIASLEQALGADGYAAGNAAYLGTQQHIADLEAQRAELLKTGGTAAGVAAGRDDELVAWLFGVPVPQAAALKWLLFVGVFDVLSLLLRLFGDLVQAGASAAELATRRYRALLDSGLTVPQAATLLAGGTAALLPALPQAAALTEHHQDAGNDAPDASGTVNRPAETLNRPDTPDDGLNTAHCAHCGQVFAKQVKWQKYCSEPCRKAGHKA